MGIATKHFVLRFFPRVALLCTRPVGVKPLLIFQKRIQKRIARKRERPELQGSASDKRQQRQAGKAKQNTRIYSILFSFGSCNLQYLEYIIYRAILIYLINGLRFPIPFLDFFFTPY